MRKKLFILLLTIFALFIGFGSSAFADSYHFFQQTDTLTDGNYLIVSFGGNTEIANHLTANIICMDKYDQPAGTKTGLPCTVDMDGHYLISLNDDEYFQYTFAICEINFSTTEPSTFKISDNGAYLDAVGMQYDKTAGFYSENTYSVTKYTYEDAQLKETTDNDSLCYDLESNEWYFASSFGTPGKVYFFKEISKNGVNATSDESGSSNQQGKIIDDADLTLTNNPSSDAILRLVFVFGAFAAIITVFIRINANKK